MSELIYYNVDGLKNTDLEKYPGMENFLYFFKIYSPVPIFDRSNSIKLPINTKSLFPIPKFVKMDKTFEQICNERARFILDLSTKQNKKIYVMYSGGIDSTLVLVSLLKNSTETERKNIIVLLSEESINENPSFYKKFISGKLITGSSSQYIYILGSENIFLTGEHNDHLFGSIWTKELMEKYGNEIIHKPYDTKTILDFFNSKNNNLKLNQFCIDLLEKIIASAPMKITTFFDFFWWISFVIRWQGFVFYPIISAKHIEKINEFYFEENYITFYGSEDFQLWSMNNFDKKIKNDWKSYKWLCKEIIYEFAGDEDYRDNKIKVPSFRKILSNVSDKNFLDSKFKISKEINIEKFYNKDNSFK